MIKSLPNLAYTVWALCCVLMLIGLIDLGVNRSIHEAPTMYIMPFAVIMILSGFVYAGLSKLGQSVGSFIQLLIIGLWAYTILYPVVMALVLTVSILGIFDFGSIDGFLDMVLGWGLPLWLCIQFLAILLLLLLFFARMIRS